MTLGGRPSSGTTPSGCFAVDVARLRLGATPYDPANRQAPCDWEDWREFSGRRLTCRAGGKRKGNGALSFPAEGVGKRIANGSVSDHIKHSTRSGSLRRRESGELLEPMRRHRWLAWQVHESCLRRTTSLRSVTSFDGSPIDWPSRLRRCRGAFADVSPEGNAGPWIDADGRRLLQFSTNNYLGLAMHPKVRERAWNSSSNMGSVARWDLV